MKKSVLSYQTLGENPVGLEILLDLGRELTEDEKYTIQESASNILTSIKDASLSLDPKTKSQAEEERTSILSCFSGREIFVEETKNEYFQFPYGKYFPWFVITTSKGRIKIGWRKRVLNICWEDSTIGQSAEELFPDEDVTKFDKNIHAYGYEKAKEYIDLLLK